MNSSPPSNASALETIPPFFHRSYPATHTTHAMSSQPARRPSFLLLCLLTLSASLLPVRAQVPQLINYQGRVAVGTPAVNFDGSGSFKFALVNTNGTVTYWSNDGTSTAGSQPTAAVSLAVTKGLYSVLLGDATLANMTIVPATVFTNPDVRLRVWFNDGTNGSQLLAPDQRIAAVGYAMMAGTASVAQTVPDGAITSAKIAAGAVGSAQLAPNAVHAGNIAGGSVGSAQMANGAIGTAQLATGAVQSGNIAAGAVGYTQIAAAAVAGDAWNAVSSSALAGRTNYTAVWTGSEVIVWGGYNQSLPPLLRYLNDGARYNPTTNTWTAMSTAGAPAARGFHTAIWTGSEMIVWGGFNGSFFDDGARYNPTTDTWTAVTATSAPAARRFHTAVWTGSEMIVWAGFGASGYLDDGARYNPAGAGSWAAIPNNLANAPAARDQHSAVWTGSEMIVWGGLGNPNGIPGGTYLSDGGRYNPAGGGSWTAIPNTLPNTPAGRHVHTTVWTGAEMIVWGGYGSSGYLNTGGRYNPTGNSWTSVTTTTAPVARYFHTAVWTGSEMVVWGGYNGDLDNYFNDGWRYNPAGDSWTTVTAAGTPSARYFHTAVWTGGEMIVWGGYSFPTYFSDGARLRLGNIAHGTVGSLELAANAVQSGNISVPLSLSGSVNTTPNGVGVLSAINTGTGAGIFGQAGTGGNGVYGLAGTGGNGVYGNNATGTGVAATSDSGWAIYAASNTGYGIYAQSNTTEAGHFVGNVGITGNLTVGGTTAGIFTGNGAGLTNLNAANLTGTITTLGGLIIENRTSDPPIPATGRIWLRTDL